MSAVAPTTILVIDDDRAIRTLVQGLLEREGYTIIMAGSEEAALALFRLYQKIGLLLTDVTIPGISGLELARHLQLERIDR